MMTGTGSPASGVALSVIRRKRREAVPAPRRDAVQAPAAAKPADLRFAELGSFLAARRAEVTPEQVGLPGGGSRRLSGLRREEVAMLAGIGASWYAWIEQGRAKNVSPEILAAIAGVLRLDEAQCLYVMRLAGYTAPRRPRAGVEDDDLLGAEIVDGFLPGPAYFLDRYWDITAANTAAERLLGVEGGQANYLEMLFLDQGARSRFPLWERDAADAVARFRTQSGEFLGDPRLASLVGRLRERSPFFADLWDQHRISDGSGITQVVRHPGLGQVSLDQVCLDLSCRPGRQLILLRPHSGGDAERIGNWIREVSPAYTVSTVPA
ncbi:MULTISPECIES: helix-turn-helix domain-containing protein [Streptomyces]|uniref:Helix-turn-helix domain-containing protein n=1 Tax=Streptomyces olivaceoviridis TaxID=1921 RepID=A0ABW7V306_STROI|nr:helix-turn-helix transcriptional regulator [Streptomyces corchorusii]